MDYFSNSIVQFAMRAFIEGEWESLIVTVGESLKRDDPLSILGRLRKDYGEFICTESNDGEQPDQKYILSNT